jgi:hypothetical protein
LFNDALTRFGNIVNQLGRIPTSIEMTGNHTVSVSILGGEAWAAMERPMTDLINQKIGEAINNMISNRFSESGVGRLNQTETPLPTST